MRRGPVLIGTILVIAAFAIQINYDNQFRALMLGTAATAARGQLPAGFNQGDFSQRVSAAQGLTTTNLIRLSSYVIGAAGIMVILIGTAAPPKKATEVS